jgi:phage gpG-like protein
MSDELTVDAGRLEDVVIELQQLGDGARGRLYRAISEQALLFEEIVKTEKLDGQVLNRRSGELQNSVFSLVTEDGGGIMGTVGANTPYSRIHEYGGIIEPVNALALRFQIDGKWIYAKRVTMPERSYLRSTLAERADEIRAALLAAVAGAA